MGNMTTSGHDHSWKISGDSLEEILVDMQKFGRPLVSLLSDGWCCVVQMTTVSVGTEFQVKSDFRHSSPSSAAQECMARIHATMATLKP